MESMYKCTREGCNASFQTREALAGHLGGRHGKRALVPLRHGTAYGYVQHIRRKIPIEPDDPCGCRAAHAKMQRERRNKLKATA